MSVSQDTFYNRFLAKNCPKKNHWMAPYTKGIDQCGWVFDFCNTYQFQVFEKIRNKELSILGI